jgi:Protein of unknown function (DUF1214)
LQQIKGEAFMLRAIGVSIVFLALGLYLGYQLPRGAGLVSALVDMQGDASTEDYSGLASHQALLDFEDTFSAAREMVLKDARTEQEAIEGMRWLLRVVAMSTHIIADSNPAQPRFQRMDTWVRKAGGDNPDAEYHLAAIDGKYDYKISGNVGSVRYLGFTINAGQGATKRRQVGYLSDKTLTLDDEGNFTILLSKSKPGETGDWVEIPADTSAVLVRQYIADRNEEQLAELNIEVLGGNPAYNPPSDEEIAASIVGTTYGFFALTHLHRTVLPELMENTNAFVRATSENLGGAISGEDNLYMLGSYQIADDEALRITVTPPETRYWNLTAETRWHEIYNYLSQPTSRTLEDVTFSAGGSVEFLVAHENNGHPNWIDTSGHNFGFLTLRWLDAKQDNVPLPTVEIVKLEQATKTVPD